MKRRAPTGPVRPAATAVGLALAVLLAGCQRAPTEAPPTPTDAPPANPVAVAPAAPASAPASTLVLPEPAASATASLPHEGTAVVPSLPASAAASAPVAEAPALPGSAPEPQVAQVEPAPEPEAEQAPRPGESFGHMAGLHRVPDRLKLNSSAAYVIDSASGESLYGKNETAVLPVASLTKLMTALVLRDAKQALDEEITITEDDKDREKNSRSRLRVGTTLTRGLALHLALMSSENRAAHALARHYPGGVEAFVAAMNRRAKAMGLQDTHFADPTGLSSQNQSTARDIARLARAASQDELISELSTAKGYLLPVGKRTLQYRNSNGLVRRGSWDIELQKTGFTNEAGQCVVMQTRLGGKDVIVVLLDADSKSRRTADAERIRRFLSGDEDGSRDRKYALATTPGSRGSR